MRISIDVCAHYDWEPLPPDAGEPTEEDVKALRVKPSHSGGWLMKVRRVCNTQTDISIPEAQIVDLLAHHERQGAPKRRGSVVAWLLEEKVMPHHAHTDAMDAIHVEGEPDVEEFLNAYFETGYKAGGGAA